MSQKTMMVEIQILSEIIVTEMAAFMRSWNMRAE